MDALLFGLLGLIWLVTRQYNRLLQRLSAKERIRITWAGGAAPAITVVQVWGGWSVGGQVAPAGSRELTMQHLFLSAPLCHHSCMPSYPPF